MEVIGHKARLLAGRGSGIQSVGRVAHEKLGRGIHGKVGEYLLQIDRAAVRWDGLEKTLEVTLEHPQQGLHVAAGEAGTDQRSRVGPLVAVADEDALAKERPHGGLARLSHAEVAGVRGEHGLEIFRVDGAWTVS